jgi:hypothetical protein
MHNPRSVKETEQAPDVAYSRESACASILSCAVSRAAHMKMVSTTRADETKSRGTNQFKNMNGRSATV